MGRHKTISDDDVLRVARDVFRAHGHTATTRQVAQAAGISEAVLYQRFGSKDQLFFAAMRPTGPDIEHLLGPADPPGDGREYLRAVVARVGRHFAEAIPLALRVMTHPSFDPAALARVRPGGPPALRDAFSERISALVRRGRVATSSPTVVARLLLSLAHDWALGQALHGGPAGAARGLREMVDVVWEGLRPRGAA
jgi:AcrR family transcriptional regulator